MEVRIGIIHSPREINFESNDSTDELRGRIEAALAEGKQPLVSFTDAKGREYLVPTASIAYVELGGESGRRVGFVS